MGDFSYFFLGVGFFCFWYTLCSFSSKILSKDTSSVFVFIGQLVCNLFIASFLACTLIVLSIDKSVVLIFVAYICIFFCWRYIRDLSLNVRRLVSDIWLFFVNIQVLLVYPFFVRLIDEVTVDAFAVLWSLYFKQIFILIGCAVFFWSILTLVSNLLLLPFLSKWFFRHILFVAMLFFVVLFLRSADSYFVTMLWGASLISAVYGLFRLAVSGFEFDLGSKSKSFDFSKFIYSPFGLTAVMYLIMSFFSL